VKWHPPNFDIHIHPYYDGARECLQGCHFGTSSSSS
jgi:hypothetical protein